MSTSSVAALSAVGADSTVVAVSGLKYISDPKIRLKAETGQVLDIGYDSSLDYETLIRLKPELIVAYMVGDAEPPYLTKVRALGLTVMIVSDHLEQHPLARAEYVKLFGALTGRLAGAQDFFNGVRDRYLSLCVGGEGCPDAAVKPVKVLKLAQPFFSAITRGRSEVTMVFTSAGCSGSSPFSRPAVRI